LSVPVQHWEGAFVRGTIVWGTCPGALRVSKRALVCGGGVCDACDKMTGTDSLCYCAEPLGLLVTFQHLFWNQYKRLLRNIHFHSFIFFNFRYCS